MPIAVHSPAGPWALYQGAEAAPNFGDQDAEFCAALMGCAVIDEPWRRRLRVSGSDAARWLNGMLTNTSSLEDGAGNYSFLLNAQGRIQGDVTMFRDGATYLLETSAEQIEKVRAWLDHYIIMDDVELAPETEFTATLALAGPRASQLLARLQAMVDEAAPLRLRTVAINGTECICVQDAVSPVPCFHLWQRPEDKDTLWTPLVACGAIEAGFDTWERLRIAGGVPAYGIDLSDRDLAQETGQERALHFNKGCYLGQEIVERIRSRGQVHRGWRGFTAPTQLHAGAEVLAEGKPIGRLTSVAALPLAGGNHFAGLGIVKLQPLEQTALLECEGKPIAVAALPFALGNSVAMGNENNG